MEGAPHCRRHKIPATLEVSQKKTQSKRWNMIGNTINVAQLRIDKLLAAQVDALEKKLFTPIV